MKIPVKLLLRLRAFKEKMILLFLGDNTFYINGPQTLPPPLCREEEQKCIDRIRNGDESAREPLIVHNLRLVVYIAKKFENSGAGVEDLISIGTIGLIKAVNTFCPDKNIKLATYASRCIENEILMYLRKMGTLKAEISLDEPLNVDWDGNELLLSDVLKNEGDSISADIELEAEKSLLIESVEKLGERERLIINMRFGIDGGREHTQKEVADILGISQSYISRLEKRIIDQLKKEMERVS
ncbi:MAG TPA: RNA polymerase sporulation sigma factor SigE [Clostridiales bacterium]|jgi:RNA polymerase sporulation-specific sigma factor|nr:RNA polymerase sporulation sigma factor SigE [Clostridiales bacterium]HOJ35131.1 RNA polymerase sporulation sigma factor SigE [Clostridiales bacterium]HOL79053.1 RNA polymerase sporulation sigma factor SigE [Clostridiales bacterium]HPP67657.1 RNA polymerase sporulation sigma factor SigE [Clostridiales bacterium]HPU66474.1 RNA polymerase sporulation sigma factor SigE [Clostridiales bacterium]